jgi:two-component system, OmpR family, response regulator
MSHEQLPPDIASKRIFTTGEAAALCKVSQQTIIRCFDAGRLTGFKVPGSKFRRIPRDELLRFMKANQIPTDILEAGKKKVLLVDDDADILDMYRDMLSRDDRLELHTASNGYDAGMLTEQVKPHLIILDYMLPDINGNVVCARIRANPALAETKVLIISGVVRREEIDALLKAGADGFLPKPFSLAELTRRMSDLLGVEGAGTPTLQHDEETDRAAA